MTLRDLVTEMTEYEYSQEAFNLMKECAEADLRFSYANTQTYLRENADMLDTNYAYMESVADGEYDALYEGAWQAIKKAARAVWALIVKAAKAVAKFFHQGSTKLKDIIQDSNEARDNIEVVQHMSDSNLQQKIYDELNSAIESRIENIGFKITSISGDRDNFTAMSKAGSGIKAPLRRYVSLATSDPDTINITAGGDTYKNGVLSTGALLDISNKLKTKCEAGGIDKDSSAQLMTELKAAKSSPKIKINSLGLEQTAEELDDVTKALDTQLKNIKVDEKATDEKSVNTAAFREFAIAYQAACANTMTLLSEVIRTKSHIVYDINRVCTKYVNKDKKNVQKEINDQANYRKKNPFAIAGE